MKFRTLTITAILLMLTASSAYAKATVEECKATFDKFKGLGDVPEMLAETYGYAVLPTIGKGGIGRCHRSGIDLRCPGRRVNQGCLRQCRRHQGCRIMETWYGGIYDRRWRSDVRSINRWTEIQVHAIGGLKPFPVLIKGGLTVSGKS